LLPTMILLAVDQAKRSIAFSLYGARFNIDNVSHA